MNSNSRAVVALAASLGLTSVAAQPVSCMVASCATGSAVKSAPQSGGVYLICPTAELSEYANTVLGVASFSQSIGQTVPPISPVTAEPSYSGETKGLLHDL